MPVYNHSGGKYVYMESLICCSDILHLHLIKNILLGFVPQNRISSTENKLTSCFVFSRLMLELIMCFFLGYNSTESMYSKPTQKEYIPKGAIANSLWLKLLFDKAHSFTYSLGFDQIFY